MKTIATIGSDVLKSFPSSLRRCGPSCRALRRERFEPIKTPEQQSRFAIAHGICSFGSRRR
jgi:hypothetical protein